MLVTSPTRLQQSRPVRLDCVSALDSEALKKLDDDDHGDDDDDEDAEVTMTVMMLVMTKMTRR